MRANVRLPRIVQGDVSEKWLDVLGDLNVCSQKGLSEKFDSTIGAGSVLMPFGGTYQLTPSDGMAAKVPVLEGETNSATIMTFGYNPKISEWSPFHGAQYAVVESVSKAVALGADYKTIYAALDCILKDSEVILYAGANHSQLFSEHMRLSLHLR